MKKNCSRIVPCKLEPLIYILNLTILSQSIRIENRLNVCDEWRMRVNKYITGKIYDRISIFQGTAGFVLRSPGLLEYLSN